MNKISKRIKKTSVPRDKIIIGEYFSKLFKSLNKSKISNSDRTKKLGGFNYISAHDKELFIKRLFFLLKAGIPILEALKMIEEQTHSLYQRKIIASIGESISNGQSLHNSLARFRKIFGNFIINVIRVGEESGLLSENLNYLAEELKKRRQLRQKIIGALVYPVFVGIATIGITVLLIVFIFPKVLPIFKSLNVPLPITTKILIGLSGFLMSYGWYVLGGFVLLIFAIIFILKITKVKIFISNIAPYVPVIGRIMQNYYLINICRTLGLLLKSNITLIEAIRATAETTPNIVYQKILRETEENILKGKKVSNQFGNYPRFFPILIPQMLAVGETTGNLSGSLIYLAEFYESEVDEMTKNLSSVLEPILMIFMGIIVGFVVISIITPIYGVTQHLNIR